MSSDFKPVEATSETTVRVYKTQLDSVGFLKNYGFKVSKSQFSRDFKAGKVAINASGHFDENALLAYANVYLTPTGQIGDRELGEATVSRIEADATLKSIQAQRFQLKLEQEQGKLMPRAEHERDLAARALFFKREIQNFIHLHGAAIIHHVGGSEQKLKDLVAYWVEATANWMDAWAAEREFVLDMADDNSDVPQAVEPPVAGEAEVA